jgi:hypothetical protein
MLTCEGDLAQGASYLEKVLRGRRARAECSWLVRPRESYEEG